MLFGNDKSFQTVVAIIVYTLLVFFFFDFPLNPVLREASPRRTGSYLCLNVHRHGK